MAEESISDFPQPNTYELVGVYIKTQLEKVGIILKRIDIDGTVITDKKIPEEIMLSIYKYAASKGITIKFPTSG